MASATSPLALHSIEALGPPKASWADEVVAQAIGEVGRHEADLQIIDVKVVYRLTENYADNKRSTVCRFTLIAAQCDFRVDTVGLIRIIDTDQNRNKRASGRTMRIFHLDADSSDAGKIRRCPDLFKVRTAIGKCTLSLIPDQGQTQLP